MTLCYTSPPLTSPLSENARTVMERRIVARDGNGDPVETPDQCFRRVANNIAGAEHDYFGGSNELDATNHYVMIANKFYHMMASLDFLPNSPTLVNAGRKLQQLSACFVLPVEDSIKGIFKSVGDTAVIHQSGGGTGFSFSRLRPANDKVKSTMGIASGPVSFMTVFDSATEVIKQGGTRRGANMGILRVDHPDIELFIDMKSDMETLTNFNISVAITDQFMSALTSEPTPMLYAIYHPVTGEIVDHKDPAVIWEKIVKNAWKNGDPGIVFIDRINDSSSNPVPSLGPIEATNPCGESPLYSYDSCNLGSINLSMFSKEDNYGKTIDYDRLKDTVHLAVRFLDNVIHMSNYPLPEIEDISRQIRRVGLGVMGWADLLIDLGLPYDSEEAISAGRRVMAFIQEEADTASAMLAVERGPFPKWEESIYHDGKKLRNATRTTIAPTGTISIIAGCSSGIEPLFALAYTRSHYLDKNDPSKRHEMKEVNRRFLKTATDNGFYSDELIDYLANGGSVKDRDDVPQKYKDIFVTSHDISPDSHIGMQAAFQEYTDNAVSKTINFSNSATVIDIHEAYMLAWREGCRGVTIYRDGSRDEQVLKHAAEEIKSDTSVLHVGRERRRMPDERKAIIHKFRVGDQEGYISVGLFEDGTPGEVFINASRMGSTVMALLDTIAILTSYSLQHGVSIDALAGKMKGSRFEPNGPTGNPDIPIATSVVDYIFRWLEMKFSGVEPATAMVRTGEGCTDCGSVLFFEEGCLKCQACGFSKCG